MRVIGKPARLRRMVETNSLTRRALRVGILASAQFCDGGSAGFAFCGAHFASEPSGGARAVQNARCALTKDRSLCLAATLAARRDRRLRACDRTFRHGRSANQNHVVDAARAL